MKRAVLGGAALVAAFLTPASAVGAEAAEAPPAQACRAGLERWSEINLYFGRNISGGGEVSEAQFQTFLSQVVTPRFPDGLTVLDADGQFRDGGRTVREKTKLLVLLVPAASAVAGKVQAIITEYKSRFRQQSVLRTEDRVCLAFD